MKNRMQVKGCYLLVVENDISQVIPVGASGDISFPAGWYVYVGSAMGGLEQRISRHRRSTKNMHWHIDYLLAKTRLADVHRIVTDKRLECGLAGQLRKRLDPVQGFGCSDCRCGSHLFYHADREAMESAIAEVIENSADIQ